MSHRPLLAEHWYLARQGQLLWQGDTLTFTAAQARAFEPLAEARLPLAPGYGLLLLRELPPTLSVEPGLRRALAQAGDEEAYARLARAAQLATWFDQHRFCGRCGSPLIDHAQDLARTCPACALVHYPRISPCIIVLVRRGEQCLLARSERFPPGRFSTLAGFIEAGETAEQAVRREVREEVGIEVDNLEFFASQAWPFPHQLMLGFFADYRSGELRPDGIEIVAADWFDRERLPDLPPPFSISRQLIDHFFMVQSPLND